MSVESAGMVVVVGGLRLPCLSTAKPNEQTGKSWLKLPCLSAAKPSKRTGKPWLRLPCLNAAKPSERIRKPWLRLPCLSVAKLSEQAEKTTEVIKTGWSLCPFCVCLQTVCFDEFVRTVRDTPTLRMETSNSP